MIQKRTVSLKNPRGKLTHPSQGQELGSAGWFTDQTKNSISNKKCEKVLYVTVIYTTDINNKSHSTRQVKMRTEIVSRNWEFAFCIAYEAFSTPKSSFFICWIALHQLKFFGPAITKKDMNAIYRNFYVVYQRWVMFQINNFYIIVFSMTLKTILQ